jgi:predicted ATPase/class 3 adenylate cyclase
MHAPATAPVTLVYADLAGSTVGWREHGPTFGASIAAMHAVARERAEARGGDYVKSTGDGFILAFPSPLFAVICAAEIQREILCGEAFADRPRLALRVGVHTDTPTVVDGEYTGFAMWQAQRVMDAAQGAQILMSETTYILAKRDVSAAHDCSCEPLGSFQLRDLLEPIALYRVIVPGVPLSELPPRVMPAGSHNLPEEERPFIGRAREVAEVAGLLAHEGTRLVTITGIGGIGKSRLAKQAAAQRIDDYPDGVWLADMEDARSREDAVAAIRAALPVETGPEFPGSGRSGALGSARLLLILDCFERLEPHAALVDDLLRAAPSIRCLVTSRCVLGLPREFEYPLLPMDAGGADDADKLPEPVDAMALFSEAASHVVHDFAVTPANRPMVAELCRELEGIPLCLVLAAGRLRQMSLPELTAEVRTHRLAVLKRRMPGVDRHGAMRDVVAASIDMLQPETRHLLEQVSLFQGGFFQDDAAAVCTFDDGIDLLDGLAALRENSLLHAQIVDERTRYRLLDTVREYVTGTVAPGDEAIEASRRRHAERYAALAASIGTSMNGGRWAEAMAHVRRESANLRAAVGYAAGVGSLELLIAFGGTLARIYFEAGLWDDFGRLVEAAAPAAEALGREDVANLLLGLRGARAARQGDIPAARALWEQRVERALVAGDVPAAADNLFDLANLAREAGDYTGARKLLRRAMGIARDYGDSGLLGTAYAVLAAMKLAEGAPQEARRAADRAVRAAQVSGDVEARLFIQTSVGRVYLETGDERRAEAALHEAIGLAMDGDRDLALIGALIDVGRLHERGGRPERAAMAYAAAASIRPGLPCARTALAHSALDRFRRSLTDPRILSVLDEAREAPWQQSVASLLADPGGDLRPGPIRGRV